MSTPAQVRREEGSKCHEQTWVEASNVMSKAAQARPDEA